MISWLKKLFTKPVCAKCKKYKPPIPEEVRKLRREHIEHTIGAYRTYIWYDEFNTIDQEAWDYLEDKKRG